jgi:hypothetical protein
VCGANNEHRRAERWTALARAATAQPHRSLSSLLLEKPCALLAWLSGTSCRSLSRGRSSLRALLLAAHGYLQLLDAARIARRHAGGPRYARLLASPGWIKHIALVSRGKASFARGCLWLLMAALGSSRQLAASRRLASTRPTCRLAGWAHRLCLASRCAVLLVAGNRCARLVVMLCRGICAFWSKFVAIAP